MGRPSELEEGSGSDSAGVHAILWPYCNRHRTPSLSVFPLDLPDQWAQGTTYHASPNLHSDKSQASNHSQNLLPVSASDAELRSPDVLTLVQASAAMRATIQQEMATLHVGAEASSSTPPQHPAEMALQVSIGEVCESLTGWHLDT